MTFCSSSIHAASSFVSATIWLSRSSIHQPWFSMETTHSSLAVSGVTWSGKSRLSRSANSTPSGCSSHCSRVTSNSRTLGSASPFLKVWRASSQRYSTCCHLPTRSWLSVGRRTQLSTRTQWCSSCSQLRINSWVRPPTTRTKTTTIDTYYT